jgi:carbon monoxide dehydrogenase subunit G
VRATSIKAPPEKIFPFINDFHRWGAWSPYEKKDPAMTRSFGAATSGKGAAYAWDGNKDVGQGRMEITESSAPSKVAIRLDFVRPFEAHNAVEFTLEPTGDATAVTWRMQGRMPYLAKVFGLFCDMDGMVGKDFEAGLASLKTAAER